MRKPTNPSQVSKSAFHSVAPTITIDAIATTNTTAFNAGRPNSDPDDLGHVRDEDGQYDHADSPFHRSAYTGAADAVRDFVSLFHAGVGSLHPDSDQRRSLGLLVGRWGITEALLASNFRVRLEATKLLIKQIEREYQQRRSGGRSGLMLATFISDDGNALEYAPEVDVAGFSRKIDKLIREAKLDGVFALELQALTNFPDNGDGRSLMLHAHAVVWSDDPDFDRLAVQRQLQQSGRLRHWLDADTVRLTEISDDAAEVRWVAGYLLKAPFLGKRLKPSASTSSGFELTDAKLRPDLAVRLMEGLSQLQVTDLVRGVAGGTKITRAWRKRLLAWHRRKCRNTHRVLPKSFDVGALWAALNDNRRGITRAPFNLSCKRRPGPSAWDAAAARRMDKERVKARQQARQTSPSAGRGTEQTRIPIPRHGAEY